MLYVMHYITNINKSNISGQLTNLKTWKETNNFSGYMYPLNCSLHCMYEVFLHMQHSTETWIIGTDLYHENENKLTKWLMQKCTSQQWVNISTYGSN